MWAWLSRPSFERGRWTRRELLRAGVAGLGGLTLPRLLAAEAAGPRRRRARA